MRKSFKTLKVGDEVIVEDAEDDFYLLKSVLTVTEVTESYIRAGSRKYSTADGSMLDKGIVPVCKIRIGNAKERKEIEQFGATYFQYHY